MLPALPAAFACVPDPALHPDTRPLARPVSTSSSKLPFTYGSHPLPQAFEHGVDKFCVDLAGDVAILAVVEYLADLFGIPLKTKSNPLGLFTVDGLCDALTDLNTFV
ncbi:hypothetical protein JCM9279_003387 [Rhodotorula babjevae]